MTTVVIGSNSFSGSHYVELLLQRGEQVIGVSRSSEPHPVFLPYRGYGAREPEGFTFVQADLNHDLDRVAEVLRAHQPKVVVNFAAQSMVAQSWERPQDWYQTNLVATVQLHDLLRQHDALERYVHVSTPEVYGSCSGVIDETAPLNPSTPYAVSRAACDMSLRAYHQRYGFPVLFTRAANVYGPGQQLYRILPRAVVAGIGGPTLSLHGGGVALRSFIHIRDVVEGTQRVVEQGTPGDCYHLSTARHVTIRELCEEVFRQLEAPFAEHVEVGPGRPNEDSAYLLGTAKAEAELGWQPKIELAEGVGDVIAWARAHRETILAQPLQYVHKA